MLPLALLPPPAPPFAPAFTDLPPNARVGLANAALDRLWTKGWASVPSLDPDALIAKASARARAVPDDAAVGWRRRLELLCSDLREHAGLTNLGLTLAHGQLVSALSNRFRAHALWQRHPEIGERPIAGPIIVVGQMRSGTTRMQRLLACDPRLTFTRFYESWNPIPERDSGAPFDDRALRGWLGLTIARLLNPAFDAIHPTGWRAPDEEIGLQNLSLFGSAFETQWRVPNYVAAVEADDGHDVYGEFKKLLQTLAWLRRDSESRPLILKVPQFTQDLPALLRAFPDARLIVLDRDPLDVVASSASLVFNQMSLQSDDVDPHWIGQEWSRKVALRAERVGSGRAGAAAPQVDIAFDDVTRDWRREMHRVYEMLRLPLTEDVLAKMDSYVRSAERRSRERHHYDPAHFGLPPATPAQLALAG